MKVLLRVDASRTIGIGHVMRCLTLAHELKSGGAEVAFASRRWEGNLFALIESAGFRLLALKAPAGAGMLGASQEEDAAETAALASGGWDAIVVDHYGADALWENAARSLTGKILVIDDTADRNHHCDLLLDQNLFSQAELRYAGKLPPRCKQLLGPAYALLRKEFAEARKELANRAGKLEKVLIFYGGTDIENQTSCALKAIQMVFPGKLQVDVVLGPANSHGKELESSWAGKPNVRFHRNPTSMAALMAAADFSFGGGGTTTWERCALGLPALVTIMAANQREPALEAERAGVQKVAGEAAEVTADALAVLLADLGGRRNVLAEMSRHAMQLVDGLGTARVAEALVL